MKEEKIFRAMSNIDEDLINEAVDISTIRKRNVVKYVGAASAVLLTAISAAMLLYVYKPLHKKAASETSAVILSVKEKNTEDALKAGADEDLGERTSEKTTDSTIDKQTPAIDEEDESSHMLGFMIRDGKAYYQVINESEYTLDEQIGFAADFAGAYHDLKDGSAVYTVKEDESILVVKFAAGGTATLMLWEEGLQDAMGFCTFHGLRVDRSLMAALLSNDGRAYSVYVTRPDSEDMYEYQYNGRSIGEIRQALEESWKTADGKNNPVEKEYQEALDAFLREKMQTVYAILSTNGIQVEKIGDFRCEAEMTKEQFEALGDAGINLEEYAFCLLSGNYFMDDSEA